MRDRKILFVTGAGSGIGREVARHFAAKGWFAGLTDVNEDSLAETAAMLGEENCWTRRLDVADRDAWKAVIAAFSERTDGRLHLLFNNAGIGKGGPFQDMDPADIDRLVAINFTGVMNGTQAAFDLLKASPGACILNTCSASGIYGSAGLSVYSATKFAVRGLTEAWDIEFRQYGIKVRSLMPGFIDTNILSAVSEGSNRSGKQKLQSAGIEVSPVAIVGQAAWDAVHGNAVHVPVNKMARQLQFAARWFPGRLRKKMGMVQALDGAVDS